MGAFFVMHTKLVRAGARSNARLLLAFSVMSVAMVTTTSEAAWFGPRNYASCVDDASRRPTDAGVKLAMRQCYEKFKKPEEEAAERKRQAENNAFREKWGAKAKAHQPLSDVVREFGEPVWSFKTSCHVYASGQPVAKDCMMHRWADRSGEVGRWYQLQTRAVSGVAVIWAVWEDPITLY